MCVFYYGKLVRNYHNINTLYSSKSHILPGLAVVFLERQCFSQNQNIHSLCLKLLQQVVFYGNVFYGMYETVWLKASASLVLFEDFGLNGGSKFNQMSFNCVTLQLYVILTQPCGWNLPIARHADSLRKLAFQFSSSKPPLPPASCVNSMKCEA